jgi:hypothetical protein
MFWNGLRLFEIWACPAGQAFRSNLFAVLRAPQQPAKKDFHCNPSRRLSSKFSDAAHWQEYCARDAKGLVPLLCLSLAQ